jgi:protein-disulfide isomerase
MLAARNPEGARVAESNSGALVISALIIGSSIVAGSFLVRSSVDRTGTEVRDLRGAIEAVARAGPPRDTAMRDRPDANRRYTVSTKDAPVRGDPDAKIAVIEFSDFQCPFCGRAVPLLDQISKTYGNKVKIVFKHLPLSIHPKAPAAHAAAEAAHRQGKFWQMHDKIFADQEGMSPERYEQYAKEIGLDMARFKRDVADASIKKRIDADAAEAEQLGVTGTPAFFVDGRYLPGAVPFERIKVLLDESLGKAS